MKVHWGPPALTAGVTIRLPSIRSAAREYRSLRHNQILSLYGISFGERLFIGVIRMTDGVHEETYIDLAQEPHP